MSASPYPSVTLPIEPLLNLFVDDEKLGLEHIASVCGIGRRAMIRWKTSGLTLNYAEQVAHQLGLHPSAIWGMDYYYAVKADEDRSMEMMERKLARQKLNRINQQQARLNKKLEKIKNG
jgi:hypothetical protein